MRLEEGRLRDFPGGPVVKALPSKAGGVGSIPSQGARISQPKNQNIKQKQDSSIFNKYFSNGPR